MKTVMIFEIEQELYDQVTAVLNPLGYSNSQNECVPQFVLRYLVYGGHNTFFSIGV